MSESTLLIEKLCRDGDLTDGELLHLLKHRDEEGTALLRRRAQETREHVFGKDVYIRGLIELTNYCKNDCYYCGIRRSNRNAVRYRLTDEQILTCCRTGHRLGFRTFVLQGGEDPWYTDERLEALIRAIKAEFPDCAVTLSLGERCRASYQRLFDAGADRYLLRHETATAAHYARLHPPQLRLETRMRCLQDLKEIGYQVGCGFMVGSPYQTEEDLVRDLRFVKDFRSHMVGIGPFLSHKDTPFRDRKNGSAELTLFLLSLLRLMLPEVLLPATTALGTARADGREQGILHGANVVMPNLSPTDVRQLYTLYDNKICTGEEAAECIACLRRRVESVGCRIAVSRGDSPLLKQKPNTH